MEVSRNEGERWQGRWYTGKGRREIEAESDVNIRSKREPEESASGYILRLPNWIAFQAVASNGPITVADGKSNLYGSRDIITSLD